MNWFKQYCYNSESFFLLRTTGWLIGLAVGVLTAILWSPLAALYMAIIASIVSDFYLFYFKGYKESSFKNPEILLKHMDDVKRFDKYAAVMNWVKPIVLVLITLIFNQFRIEDGGPFIMVMFVSSFLYPIVTGMFISGRVAILTKAMRMEEMEENTIPTYYGVPGYNSQGVYTGSPTSNGGCSN